MIWTDLASRLFGPDHDNDAKHLVVPAQLLALGVDTLQQHPGRPILLLIATGRWRTWAAALIWLDAAGIR